jgi:hypothetical protein
MSTNESTDNATNYSEKSSQPVPISPIPPVFKETDPRPMAAAAASDPTTTQSDAIIPTQAEYPKRLIHFCNFLDGNKELRRIEKLFDRIKTTNQTESFGKDAVKQRFIFILHNFQKRAVLYARFYYFGHFIVTVGSLIVPALLSIQYTSKNSLDPTNFDERIYWATWILSLLVTIFNGILTLFNVDKKYFIFQILLEKLKSEAYQYFTLSGRYTSKNIGIGVGSGRGSACASANGDNQHFKQLALFSHQIEKIIQKQVDEEFSKNYKQEFDKTLGQSSQSEQERGYIKNTHLYSLKESPEENMNDNDNENESENANEDDRKNNRIKNTVNNSDLGTLLNRVLLYMKNFENPQATQATQATQAAQSALSTLSARPASKNIWNHRFNEADENDVERAENTVEYPKETESTEGTDGSESIAGRSPITSEPIILSAKPTNRTALNRAASQRPNAPVIADADTKVSM